MEPSGRSSIRSSAVRRKQEWPRPGPRQNPQAKIARAGVRRQYHGALRFLVVILGLVKSGIVIEKRPGIGILQLSRTRLSARASGFVESVGSGGRSDSELIHVRSFEPRQRKN